MSGKYDLSKYVFPDRKIEARKHRFRIIGEDIAAYFTRLAQETYGCDEPIRFRAACVDSLSDDYFHRVRLFKFNNDFRPDERINPPKMAALMVEACKRATAMRLYSSFRPRCRAKPSIIWFTCNIFTP
jgi:hypothetical protein